MALTSRHLLIVVVILLAVSLSANFYQMRHGSPPFEDKQVLSSEWVDDRDQASPEGEEALTQDSSDAQIIETAERFITFAFTWKEGTYATRKRQAAAYMTTDLQRTLFTSDGSTDAFETRVSDIEVFPSTKDSRHCLVRFNQELTIEANGYKENFTELVELTFTTQNGKAIVDQLKSLQYTGGA